MTYKRYRPLIVDLLFYSFISEAIYELGSGLGPGETNTNRKVSVLGLCGLIVTWGVDT